MSDVTYEMPDCEKGETHDFDVIEGDDLFRLVGGIRENPGVWGSGGGVRIADVCIHCGCKRVRDTGASDPATGATCERTSYYPESFKDEVENIRNPHTHFTLWFSEEPDENGEMITSESAAHRYALGCTSRFGGRKVRSFTSGQSICAELEIPSTEFGAFTEMLEEDALIESYQSAAV